MTPPECGESLAMDPPLNGIGGGRNRGAGFWSDSGERRRVGAGEGVDGGWGRKGCEGKGWGSGWVGGWGMAGGEQNMSILDPPKSDSGTEGEIRIPPRHRSSSVCLISPASAFSS